MESILMFTLCYILFCVCFVFPPQEIVSVGLTVESIFSSWLKSERNSFIFYHIRRTVATLLVHSCIPLGYVLGIKYISPETSIWGKNIFLDFLVISAITLPLVTASVVFQWYQSNWKNHPIAKNLKNFTNGDDGINQIARDIDMEYLRIGMIIKCSAVTKVIATDNWIIKIMPYSLNIAHQSDTTLVVISSDTHPYIPDKPEGSQYLNIQVKSSRPNVSSFQIRINSADFSDLQNIMIRPINVLENVEIVGSLTDCFLNEFKEQIKNNPKVLAPDNLDVCIGCLLATPNVKLMTSCGDTGPGKCSMCYCKPLWCEDCIGKWFASRQDPSTPENWLSSKSTCPMCRSTFCLLDVCHLIPSSESKSEEES